MKPIISDFQADFMTEAGKTNTSREAFAFVEKNGLACWVVAEQIDLCDEKESAKLAVEQLIGDFTFKPTMSQAKLKEYLNNAHAKLEQESQKPVRLKVSLVMVVSDYSKMIWAVAGNVRLYHFRDGGFNFRSKDQTMAQLMLDSGSLAESDINQRNERNGLINYLGISTKFAPQLSRSYELAGGDRIFICNMGLWETKTSEALAALFAQTKDPEEALSNLQIDLAQETAKAPKQFIAAVIHIQRIGSKQWQDHLNPKNLAVGLGVAALLGIGCLMSSLGKGKPDGVTNRQLAQGEKAVATVNQKKPLNLARGMAQLTTKDGGANVSSAEDLRTQQEAAALQKLSQERANQPQNSQIENPGEQGTVAVRPSLPVKDKATGGKVNQPADLMQKPQVNAFAKQQKAAETKPKVNDSQETAPQREEREQRQLRETAELQKQREAEAAAAKAEATPESAKSSNVPAEKPKNAGSSREDSRVSLARGYEKDGDGRYAAENYSEALKLYKKAYRIFDALGMFQDVARLERKINGTIKHKLGAFLKEPFKN